MPQAALSTPVPVTGTGSQSPVAEEELGVPIPAPGLLQVTERRRKYGPPTHHAPQAPRDQGWVSGPRCAPRSRHQEWVSPTLFPPPRSPTLAVTRPTDVPLRPQSR